MMVHEGGGDRLDDTDGSEKEKTKMMVAHEAQEAQERQ